jgi:NitT/TauT family transport system substrate-binding protein
VHELPLVVGIRKGFFADEQLDVRRIESPAPLSVAAVLAGEADYTLAVNSAAAAVVGAGAPMKIFLGLAIQPLQTVVASDPSIRGVGELRGQLIGMPKGSTVPSLFRMAVAAHGLNPDTDIVTQELRPGPDRLDDLRTGKMGAAVLDVGYVDAAEQAGAHVVMLPSEFPKVPSSGLAASQATLDGRPATAERMVRASLRAVRFMRENRDETVALIMDNLGVSRAAAERAYTLSIDAFAADGIIPDEAMQAVIDLVRGLTGSTRAATPAQLADFTLARRVAEP